MTQKVKTTCKNCGHIFHGNFCNNCGQEADIKKLNLHFIWSDIQQGMFNLNRGILYTVKQLYTRPGHAIRDFIDGKRVNYTQPVSFVIILATIYGILYYYFKIDFSAAFNQDGNSSADIDIQQINEFIALHYAWFTLATIPLFGISSKLIFIKQDYTFFEHLVLNAYLAGQRILLHIMIFPLLLILYDKPGIKAYIGLIQMFDFLLITWGYTQFFNKLRKPATVLLSMLTYLLSFVFLFIFEFIVILIFELISR